MTHLLDTNAVIAYIRGKEAVLLKRMGAARPSDLGLCTIVLAELYYGAYHSGASNVAMNLVLIENIRPKFPSIGFDERAAVEFGKLREHLSSTGQLIGPYDMLIAATALANGLILVTHNTSDFGRVPGLAIEDWQVP